jgi:hypothetical protein
MNIDHLKKTVLGVGGIAGGLALATALFACSPTNETSNANNNDDAVQSPDQTISEATHQDPPTTVVIYVNESNEGGGKLATLAGSSDDGTDSSDPVTEGSGDTDITDVSAEAVVPDDTPVDDTPVDDAAAPLDHPLAAGVTDFRLEIVHPDYLDHSKVYDICAKYPFLCEGLMFEELPEPCDSEDGTCPGWVIEEILDELIKQIPPGCTFDDKCGPSLLEDIFEEINDIQINPGMLQPLMPARVITPRI